MRRYDIDITPTQTTQPGEPGSLRPRASPGLVPERLARFEVRRELGAGAMGVVYEGVDDELGRPVALKLVHPQLSSPSRQRRLLREAQALARLAHPNVLVVYEVGSVEDTVFIAMEYVEGQNLGDWLREQDRSWTEVLRVFSQAGAGLAAAHAVGLVHRDFKPANVLIGEDGRVRVADFGLARALEQPEPSDPQASASVSSTRTAGLAGTPAYMAPELLAGGSADARSDQYSFCVALYEALYGQRPYDEPTALQRDPRARELPRPPAGTAVPAWVRSVLARGLGPRAQRWPDLDSLLQALDLDRRRRRLALLGALLGLLLIGALALALARAPSQAPACPASAHAIGTWTEDARAQLRTHLAELGGGEAPALARADRLVARLDTYAQSWQRASLDSCVATHVEGRQSDALLDARARCLAERSSDFQALVTVLRAADLDASERAREAIDQLPALAPCSDPEYVSAALPPPADPQLAAEVELLREAESELLALRSTGQFVDARARLERLWPRVEASAHAPLEAAYELLRGRIANDLGEGEASAEALERAYLRAESCGAFAIAQQAALELVHVHGYRLEQLDEAKRWRALAEAKISYTGDSSARVELAVGWGDALSAASDPALALAAYESAAALQREQPEPSELRRAEILDSSGVLLMQLDRYDEAEAALREATELWRTELGDAHPYTARGYNSLGLLYYTTSRHRDAAEAFEGALRIWKRTKGPDSDDVAAMHSNLGVVYRRINEHEQARAHLERALEIREQAEDANEAGLSAALSNLANLELVAERPERALELNLRALEIRERIYEPDHKHVLGSLQGLAAAYMHLDQTERALEPLERILANRERALPPGHPHTLGTRNGLIEALLVLGRVAEARRVLDRNLAEIDERPAQEAALCRITSFRAKVLWAEGKRERAHEVLALGRADCERNAAQDLDVAENLDIWERENSL